MLKWSPKDRGLFDRRRFEFGMDDRKAEISALQKGRQNNKRKQAETGTKELNKRDPHWFCPLIKDSCRKDCVNFMPAFVESNDKRKAVSLHAVDDEDFFVEWILVYKRHVYRACIDGYEWKIKEISC